MTTTTTTKIQRIFQKGKKKKIFLVEISQNQNLSFRDSITINPENIRRISLFLKNIEKKYFEDLSRFLSLQIPKPVFDLFLSTRVLSDGSVG